MISREHASRIARNRSEHAAIDGNGAYKSVAAVKEVLSFIESVKKSKLGAGGSFKAPRYVVDVQDIVYRVFNQEAYAVKGKHSPKRVAVLGTAGNAMKLNLLGKAAIDVDSKLIERGSVVLVTNAAIDIASEELDSSRSTYISVISPPHGVISDFSLLKGGDSKVDLVGRVVEISKAKSIAREAGSVLACTCILSDEKNKKITVSLFGSCALAMEKIGTQSVIKLEFCSVRDADGALRVNAGDTSRVFRMHPGGMKEC